MKGKLAVLAGFGAGYVLGSRAGRQRYEQIRSGAQKLWQEPHVAEQRHKVADVARDQAAAAKDVVTEKVSEKVSDAVDKVGKGGGNGGKGGKGGSATQSVPADQLPDAPSYPV